MYYTADPVLDAARYTADMEKRAAHADAMVDEATTQIKEAFQAFKPLPYVTGSTGKLRYMPFAEAASDVICDDKVFSQLVDVLQTSECPKVKALLEAMAAKYVYLWADEVGAAL